MHYRFVPLTTMSLKIYSSKKDSQKITHLEMLFLQKITEKNETFGYSFFCCCLLLLLLSTIIESNKKNNPNKRKCGCIFVYECRKMPKNPLSIERTRCYSRENSLVKRIVSEEEEEEEKREKTEKCFFLGNTNQSESERYIIINWIDVQYSSILLLIFRDKTSTTTSKKERKKKKK